MDQKQQITDRLKQANNILVTVSSNPSVDQLSACIGFTLALNKMGKHATAVFSGAVPSTIEFLQPEQTLEANTDSLRDFIISLDKAKADKLRYKVEDKVVKIFITPYRTSITDKDLEFSQGDFNVDVVIALGVHAQAELDQAITAHGRILHDATVATINTQPGGDLGSINWLVPAASSLSELVVDLINAFDKQLIDGQIATALLTGIVAETARFSNEKTSPDTMSISAELMAAGANQQLVATKLEEPKPAPPAPQPVPEAAKPESQPSQESPASEPAPAAVSENGTLEIAHPEKLGRSDEARPVATSLDDLAGPDGEKEEEKTPRIHIDDQGSLRNIEEADEKKGDASVDPTQHMAGSRMILQPPTMGGALSASGSSADSYSDPLSLPQPAGAPAEELPSGSPAPSPFAAASATITPPPTPFMPPSMTPGSPAPSASPSMPPAANTVVGTVPSPQSDLVASAMSSAPAAASPPAHVDTARDAVSQAYGATPPSHQQPIQALNAQPLGDPLHSTPPDLIAAVPAGSVQPTQPAAFGPPPPVPPPMMPPSPQ